MRAVIERDLEVLHALARLARDYSAEGRRLRPAEVVREYEKTILDELDLMREAAQRRAAASATSPDSRPALRAARCTGTTAAPT